MENIEKELQRERKVIHGGRKILRIKPIIWIQRYWLIFSILLFLLLTTLLGFYNIKNIVFLNKEVKYVKESTIRGLIEGYMSKNFFLINPDDVEIDILGNKYVKSVKVEKIFPDKLEIDIEEYLPFLILENTEEKCEIFCKEGILLETKEDIECEPYAKENELIYFSGEKTTIVQENGSGNFYLSDEILDVSKVLKEFDITILSVTMKGNVLNISTTSPTIVMDINQEIKVELARLFLVLEELKNLKMKSNSIDIRFERPAIQIDK